MVCASANLPSPVYTYTYRYVTKARISYPLKKQPLIVRPSAPSRRSGFAARMSATPSLSRLLVDNKIFVLSRAMSGAYVTQSRESKFEISFRFIIKLCKSTKKYIRKKKNANLTRVSSDLSLFQSLRAFPFTEQDSQRTLISRDLRRQVHGHTDARRKRTGSLAGRRIISRCAVGGARRGIKIPRRTRSPGSRY